MKTNTMLWDTIADKWYITTNIYFVYQALSTFNSSIKSFTQIGLYISPINSFSITYHHPPDKLDISLFGEVAKSIPAKSDKCVCLQVAGHHVSVSVGMVGCW